MSARIFKTNDFLKTIKPDEQHVVRDWAVMNDGFYVSIQASWRHYCYYKIGLSDGGFTSVELGFPSAKDDDIINYAEKPDDPKGTVYRCVPVEVVDKMIEKHGGIIGTLNRITG